MQPNAAQKVMQLERAPKKGSLAYTDLTPAETAIKPRECPSAAVLPCCRAAVLLCCRLQRRPVKSTSVRRPGCPRRPFIFDPIVDGTADLLK